MSWVKRYCCKTSQVPLFFVNWCFYIYQLPTFSSVFQSKCCFGFPVTDLIKKYAFVHHWRRPCPSLTQNIDDPAWCSYPLVKMEIRDSIQILTTTPIFLQSNYFRQKYLEIASCSDSLLIYIWVRVDHSLLQQ